MGPGRWCRERKPAARTRVRLASSPGGELCQGVVYG